MSERVYEVLKKLNINYEVVTHPAVFTADEAKKYCVDGVCRVKNLFLRNKKGTKYMLIILKDNKLLNFKDLAVRLNEKEMSFASKEKLKKYLDIESGSVSLFSIINDFDREVEVLIDSEISQDFKVGFHPNDNTQTIIMNVEDIKKFLEYMGNIYKEIAI